MQPKVETWASGKGSMRKTGLPLTLTLSHRERGSVGPQIVDLRIIGFSGRTATRAGLLEHLGLSSD